jgi:hypothetical protein
MYALLPQKLDLKMIKPGQYARQQNKRRGRTSQLS